MGHKPAKPRSDSRSGHISPREAGERDVYLIQVNDFIANQLPNSIKVLKQIEQKIAKASKAAQALFKQANDIQNGVLTIDHLKIGRQRIQIGDSKSSRDAAAKIVNAQGHQILDSLIEELEQSPPGLFLKRVMSGYTDNIVPILPKLAAGTTSVSTGNTVTGNQAAVDAGFASKLQDDEHGESSDLDLSRPDNAAGDTDDADEAGGVSFCSGDTDDHSG